MNEKFREAYLYFFVELLEATAYGNPQVVYSILEQNLDKLNYNFADILHLLVTENLVNVESSQATEITIIILIFSNLIQQFPCGNKSSNIEIAIAGYNVALQLCERETNAENWARIQANLATAYSNRIRGEKADNLENAISYYNNALSVYTREDFPENWARIQNNLATAYSNRIRGNRVENIERAEVAYDFALSLGPREDFRENWAMVQFARASSYLHRISGDRQNNIEKAITAFEASLEVYILTDFPENWAMIQNNLGLAYLDRIRGNRQENLEIAIAAFKASLQVYTLTDFPENWAMIQNNLGLAYLDRIRGNRQENLEIATAAFEASLQVYTLTDFPENWAQTQKNLGLAYLDRITGSRQSNLEIAIAAFTAALQVETPAIIPLNLLQIYRILGNLEFAESLWKKASHWYEKAIQAVEEMREAEVYENRKRKILEENLDVYENMMQSCINSQQYDRALQTVDRSKSRYLVEIFTNIEIHPKTSSDIEKQQLQDLRRQIASLQQSLESKTSSFSPENSSETGNFGGQRTTQTRSLRPESFRQQKDNLEKKLQQLAQLLEHIKQREPEFTLTQKIQPIDIAEFQKTLETETAIVEWYIGNSNSDNSWGGSAFIITRDNIELITYTTTEIAELETWKNNYLDQYRDKKTNQIWQTTLSQKLEKLSQILRLNEIVAKIETSHQLILIPHRYLHLFPLHALQFTSEGGPKYLLDGFPDGVKYSPSLQLLQLVKNRITTRKTPPPNQQLFALQNPTEDLFNADMEVETIKTRFDLHQILLRKAATKIALNASGENLANANYLHFSCHGVFDFDYPLQSSLILADSLEPILEINPPQPPLAKGGLREENTFAEEELENNGLKTKRTITLRSGRKAIPEKCLTLRDIFGELQLPQCSLVTLSACETGLTTSTAMTDEYIGLPSGFLYAGSMNVVSSLWAVDDFATAILMIKFYQELPNADSVAIALNAAQNWMRAVSLKDFLVWIGLLKLDEKSMKTAQEWLSYSSKDRPPFKDPEYWAAFCATGY